MDNSTKRLFEVVFGILLCPPLGHNKLNSTVKIMMSEAGVEGYYMYYIMPRIN